MFRCSVIIPYFNRLSLLRRTLLALELQDIGQSAYEVIVVNDGSSDLTRDVLDAWNLTMNLKYLEFINRGSAAARNRGAEAADGEVLLFLDCDILVQKDFVRQHCEFFEHIPETVEALQLGTRRYLKNTGESAADGESLDRRPAFRDERWDIFGKYSENVGALAGGWHLVFSHNISLRKATWARSEGFDESFRGWGLEDVEFGYALVKRGGKILFNPNVEGFHQYHEASFDERTFGQWRGNLDRFMQKHRDLPVMLQLIFCDYFDPERRSQLQKAGVRKIWLHCFERFETALRVLSGSNAGPTGTFMEAYEPGIDELKTCLSSVPGNHRVACSKSRLDLIAWVQYCEHARSIYLQTY